MVSHLHRLRTARGLSQWQLFARSGVSTSILKLIEEGYRPRRNDVRARLAAALGVDEDAIWPQEAAHGTLNPDEMYTPASVSTYTEQEKSPV